MNGSPLPRLIVLTRLNTPGLSLIRCYAAKKGRKKAPGRVVFDSNLADGLVDFQKLRRNMQNTVDRLKQDYITKVSIRVLPTSLDEIQVQTDQGKAPLAELAQISIKGNQMYIIDMSSFPQFTKQAAQAIRKTGTNYDPTLEGHVITVLLPRISQEHRESLSKLAKVTSEQAKQALRKVRQKGITDVRKNKQGHSEDDTKKVEKMIQQLTDEFTENVDILLEEKTKDLFRS